MAMINTLGCLMNHGHDGASKVPADSGETVNWNGSVAEQLWKTRKRDAGGNDDRRGRRRLQRVGCNYVQAHLEGLGGAAA